MVKSLATDKLNFTSDQLVTLSAQIKSGDLTSVLELYEQDIKSPFKSAMTGTLLRSLFIQVQKAKVRFLCSPFTFRYLSFMLRRWILTKLFRESTNCSNLRS